MLSARMIVVSSQAAMLFCAVTLAAQTRGTAPSRQGATPPRPTTVRVVVRDQSGNPLERVRVSIASSLTRREATTDAEGIASLPNLVDGVYRMRFERGGFATFERELALRNRQPATVDIVLNAAPAPIAPPSPPERPPSSPVSPPAAVRTPATASQPAGPPVIVSIPTFLDRNFIGRDPLKESVLACTPNETVRLLQLRDSIAEHDHPDLDEVLYVIAGEGGIRIRGESTAVGPGWLSVIPHGVKHAMERRGRNPLVLLSTLTGAPCGSAAPTSR